MVNFVTGVRNAVRRELCSRPNINGFISSQLAQLRFSLFGLSIPTTPSLAGSAAQAVLATCPADGAPYTPEGAQLNGGQCPNSMYRVTLTITWVYSANATQYEGYGAVNVPGPIGAVDRSDWDNYGGLGQSCGPPGNFFSGSPLQLRGADPTSNSIGQCGVFNQGNNSVKSVVFTSIELLSGPDNCGNTSSTGGSADGNGRLQYDDNNGAAQDFPATINYRPPFLDIDGGVHFPGVVIGPNGPINFNLNPFTGDIDIDGPFGNSNGADSEYPPIPRTPDIPGPGDEPPPPDDGNGVIIGVIVLATSDDDYPGVTQLDGGEGPVLMVSRLGSINFGVILDGAAGWTPHISITNKRAFIECPYIGGAVSVRGFPVAGVEFELFPIYAEEPLEIVLI